MIPKLSPLPIHHPQPRKKSCLPDKYSVKQNEDYDPKRPKEEKSRKKRP
jgi:hypothetical protein